MFAHWEQNNSRHLDLFEDLESYPQQGLRRIASAIETTALAAAVSFLSAAGAMWLVETFIR